MGSGCQKSKKLCNRKIVAAGEDSWDRVCHALDMGDLVVVTVVLMVEAGEVAEVGSRLI